MKRHLWSFPGGIKPPTRKSQSTKRPIQSVTLPSQLIVPIQQHLGDIPKTIVQIGQHVLKGQALTRAESIRSVPVHAPTSGVIEQIAPHTVPHPSGLEAMCVTIIPDGQDQWIDHSGLDLERTTKSELLDHIRHCGIAGLGGAGFPTHIKLQTEATPIDLLLLNGAECEPYISADDMLMRERAKAIVQGILIMQRLVEPKETLVAIEDNKPQAIAAMKQACEGQTIEVVTIPTLYPAGGERQLIQMISGKEVPAKGIPPDVGVVCQNVGTAYAVHRAVTLGEPLISRVVTVTGNGVANAANYEALLGTPIQELVNQAEPKPDSISRMIVGGALMGFTIHHLDTPITKITNCIIAATREEMPQPHSALPCIRCGACADVCPASLLPQQLYWFAKGREFDKANAHHLFDCIECGCCSYVCPSQIPLVHYYRYAKDEIRRQQSSKDKSELARRRFEARNERLERDQQEREARRQRRTKEREGLAELTGEDPKQLAIKAAIERVNAKRQNDD